MKLDESNKSILTSSIFILRCNLNYVFENDFITIVCWATGFVFKLTQTEWICLCVRANV